MKVFRNYTLRTLFKHRSRTVVTLIGIVLSMALFTAVIESVYSGLQFLIATEKEIVGSWNGAVIGISESGEKELTENKKVLRVSSMRTLGSSLQVTGKDGQDYDLLLGEICDEGLPELMGIHLSKGAFPENDHEILIPDYIPLGLAPGDTIKKGLLGKTMTVSGTFSRRGSLLDTYLQGGSYALTGPAEGFAIGVRITFFELQDPAGYDHFVNEHPDLGEVLPNMELLQYYQPDNGVWSLLKRFAGVLVALVVFGSVALIYNSFAISVNERTRQYGILKSIGATRLQIRCCVLYEALLLSIVGIPLGLLVGCAGIGITFMALGGAFEKMFGMETHAKLKLVLSVKPLLISALISLLTTLAAAWIPSVRTVKISPMEAIRQTRDVRLKEKQLRVSRLTTKLFGFPGLLAVKGMKRNRRQYRAISVSLFMSIVLFVGASAFCDYLEDGSKTANAFGEEADILVRVDTRDKEELERLKKQLEGLAGVSDVSYCIWRNESLCFPADKIDQSLKDVKTELSERDREYYAPVQVYRNALGQEDETVFCVDGTIAFLEDTEFSNLLKREGEKQDDFFDTENPRALALNHGVFMDYDWENKKTYWYVYRVLDNAAFPAAGFMEKMETPEGYIYVGEHTDGGTRKAFVAEEDIDLFYKDSDKADYEPDWSLALLVDPLEAMAKKKFEAAAFSDENISSIPKSQLVFSMLSLPGDKFELVDRSEWEIPVSFGINCRGLADKEKEISEIFEERFSGKYTINNIAGQQEQVRTLILVIHVFAYGFIILISLIAAANVFNTISTGIMLRRREFAMLRSVGLSGKGVLKILNYECLICGMKSLIIGIPVSILLCRLIFSAAGSITTGSFYVPWDSVGIAAASVFLVVFASMLYAARKLKGDNLIEAIKWEM